MNRKRPRKRRRKLYRAWIFYAKLFFLKHEQETAMNNLLYEKILIAVLPVKALPIAWFLLYLRSPGKSDVSCSFPVWGLRSGDETDAWKKKFFFITDFNLGSLFFLQARVDKVIPHKRVSYFMSHRHGTHDQIKCLIFLFLDQFSGWQSAFVKSFTLRDLKKV